LGYPALIFIWPPQASQTASFRLTNIPIGIIPSNKARNGKNSWKGRTLSPDSPSTGNKDASQEMVAVRLSFRMYSTAFIREASPHSLLRGENGSKTPEIA
jgi:hypothetical protein